jgi:hypothetical protein
VGRDPAPAARPGAYDLQATSPSGVLVSVRGVRAGQQGVTVEMPPSGSIRGTLRGFATPPVVSARLRGCEIARAGDCRQVLADVRGASFALTGLTPGQYVVTAGSSAAVATSIIDVSPASTANLELQAAPRDGGT